MEVHGSSGMRIQKYAQCKGLYQIADSYAWSQLRFVTFPVNWLTGSYFHPITSYENSAGFTALTITIQMWKIILSY